MGVFPTCVLGAHGGLKKLLDLLELKLQMVLSCLVTSGN